MKIYDALLNGTIYIENNFFNEEKFVDIKKDLFNLKYISTEQPSKDSLENRMEFYPINECAYSKQEKFVIKKIEDILECKIKNFIMKARKTIINEVKKSNQANGKYGFVHRDNKELAAILYFDHSIHGGTAFYRNYWDKYPEIEIGAYPNRCIIYDASRFHSSCIDLNQTHTFKLVIGFNYDS